MPDVNALTSALTGTNSTSGTGSTVTDRTALGKDDFLKLLVGQLQHQDPLEPSQDTEFIGQMAQFAQLEQESNTAESTSEMVQQLGRSGALGLIGRTVTYTDADDNPVTGVVKQVDIGADGKATLTIDGNGGIDAGAVTQIK
jgi:flagellar basal-body rod modification protein FlgD